MTGPVHTVRLYRWLFVSILIHSCLLALPRGFLQTLFPARTMPFETSGRDLTPDFEDIALSVVTMSGKQAVLPVETQEMEEAAVLSQAEAYHTALPGIGPPEPGRRGNSDSHADTRFFPPIPRLIVPPTLDDLDISSLSVSIRVLVGTDGRPLRIELPESLVDPEIRRRLMVSVDRFRFEPARKGNLPVESWISLPLQLEASKAR
jgi:hypothetical protein